MKLLFVAAAALLAGCVSGPQNDGRTVAEKMNGENYQSTNVVMGVPVTERKPIERKFSGQVFCGEGVAKSPVNHAAVSLLRDGQEVTSVHSDASGSYTLSAQVDPKLAYEIKTVASCGTSTRKLSSDQKRGAAGVNFNIK